MEGTKPFHWRATWLPNWPEGDHFTVSSIYVLVVQRHLLLHRCIAWSQWERSACSLAMPLKGTHSTLRSCIATCAVTPCSTIRGGSCFLFTRIALRLTLVPCLPSDALRRLLQLAHLLAVEHLLTACLTVDMVSILAEGLYTLRFAKSAWMLCSHGVQLLSEAPDCWTNQGRAAEAHTAAAGVQPCVWLCVCAEECVATSSCAPSNSHLSERLCWSGASPSGRCRPSSIVTCLMPCLHLLAAQISADNACAGGGPVRVSPCAAAVHRDIC